jgi:hypothetical protein
MAWCPVLWTTAVKVLVEPPGPAATCFHTDIVRLGLPRRYVFAESKKDAPATASDKADMMTAGLGQNEVVFLEVASMSASTERAVCEYGHTSMSLPYRSRSRRVARQCAA